jgi:exodeoxyribonuclease VIII
VTARILNASGSVESRVPRADYDKVSAVSITKLKELRRSPQHYRYLLEHPKQSKPLTLGIATHVAVLEPERFERDFATWNRVTDAGAMAPRRGQHWDEFCARHNDKTILTPAEGALAQIIAAAVRADVVAMKYLEAGEPEVTLQWRTAERDCKGRADWLTHIEERPYLVGLKTARDCRPMIFGSQCAKLGYHLQFAFYYDGFEAITGKQAGMVEIVVESAPPHAVAVYRITSDVIAQGRDEYLQLMEVLQRCEASGEWPGPVPQEIELSLPTWAYYSAEDDIDSLGLVANE